MSREVPLGTHIHRLSGLRFRYTAFTPGLEEEFTSDANAFRRRRQWLEGLLGIALYVAAAVGCEILAPHYLRSESLLRYGVVLPIILLVNLSMWMRLPRWLHESLILTASCIAGSVEVLAHRADGGDASHLVVIAVLIFVNNVMRLRLPYTLVAMGWAIFSEGVLLAGPQGSALRVEGMQAGMALAIGFLTLVASYSQDREARLAFLRHAEKEDIVETLEETNERLAAVALTDPLTGLPNRAALDRHFKRVWSVPELVCTPCSVIMVDIDHFKRLNDRYGHPYGDRVIKRVASLLCEALRGQDDFIARYGGEEFVVVLPNTPLVLGLRVAERLRGLVELAGLPSLRNSDADLQGLRATISCGVADALPQQGSDPYALIGIADEALYRAKRGGRNTVRSSADAPDVPPAPPRLKMLETLAAPDDAASFSKDLMQATNWAEPTLNDASHVA